MWDLRLTETAGYAQNGCYILLSLCRSILKLEWRRGKSGDSSNHFAHTQRFLYIANLTLLMILQLRGKNTHSASLSRSSNAIERLALTPPHRWRIGNEDRATWLKKRFPSSTGRVLKQGPFTLGIPRANTLFLREIVRTSSATSLTTFWYLHKHVGLRVDLMLLKLFLSAYPVGVGALP